MATKEESENSSLINTNNGAENDCADGTSVDISKDADDACMNKAVEVEDVTVTVNADDYNDNAATTAAANQNEDDVNVLVKTDSEDKVQSEDADNDDDVVVNVSTPVDAPVNCNNAAVEVSVNTNNAAVDIDEDDMSEKPILETLTFGLEAPEDDEKKVKDSEEMTICSCLLCDIAYSIVHKEHILAHLVMQHRIVIADVTYIADLPAYLNYWKKRFEGNDFSKFCSTIVTNKQYGQQKTDNDEKEREEFFLLCDALPEDKQLRMNLQQKRLEFILAQQQKERTETNFFRQCLFCKQAFCGNRSMLFDHLLRDHSFHMGLPDNLVFTEELFDLIQFKLDHFLCLFCEKKFRDKVSLREHMRKKQHRKINPKNKEYDRFYVINYMEVGKNWECLQSEERRLRGSGGDKLSDEEDEWAGWNEETESKVVCLFCDETWSTQKELHDHMKEKHDFDLPQVSEKLQLNFYQKIKLINYIRRQIYHKRCYSCKKTFTDKTELLKHVEAHSDHLKDIPAVTIWDQPQYFFPTYEDDKLLCLLDDNDDDGAAGDTLGVTVIAEDIKLPESILDDAELCKDLKKL